MGCGRTLLRRDERATGDFSRGRDSPPPGPVPRVSLEAQGTRPAQEVVGENTLLGCRLGKSAKAKDKDKGGASAGKPVGDVFKKYR